MTNRLTQLEYFKLSVQALGGSRSAAELIGCSERMMSRLISGQAALHEGFLADTAAALLKHAETCRHLERKISPAFHTNLVEGQPREDGRRLRHKQDAKSIAKRAAILSKMGTALEIVGGSTRSRAGMQWQIGESVFAILVDDGLVAPPTILNVPYVVVPDADIPAGRDYHIVWRD